MTEPLRLRTVLAQCLHDYCQGHSLTDVVRRVLATHYRPSSSDGGPSWLSFLGHMKDSLWSVDLFRCESILLRTHWVLMVMDQFTRRIIGFGIHAGDVDGVALCCMFNRAISGKGVPRYLSSDHDPLFEYHRWKANLRILDIEEIKIVPYAPLSHPFVGSVTQVRLRKAQYFNRLNLPLKFRCRREVVMAQEMVSRPGPCRRLG